MTNEIQLAKQCMKDILESHITILKYIKYETDINTLKILSDQLLIKWEPLYLDICKEIDKTENKQDKSIKQQKLEIIKQMLADKDNDILEEILKTTQKEIDGFYRETPQALRETTHLMKFAITEMLFERKSAENA